MSALLQLPGLTPGVWALDPVHSTVGFTVRHMMVSKVRGTFDTFSGQITVAEDALLSSVRAEIDMASINTRNAGRDGDLRSTNYFETDKYPTMNFASTAVSGSGDKYTVTGDLTLKGTTRPVELALEFHGVRSAPGMGTRAGFSATGEISRKDFGVSFEMPMAEGGVVVGDRIRIELEIEAVLQS
ncbi:polyisoprenoid-binding protein YceI [Kitasatospora sp. MAA4]|uniref:YceI family protein n=1 Tax=Kitasatospora sp. MAA4 TaxID=3035093 RepID=UPI00247391DD|nr:YceI family protein [Kitasatospora sp. MAA4]MDH6132003.1 polyisoprenoid-binding protein YceI [Kitasatospora sp. MAA4]